jgi:spore germination protein GerM
MTTKRISFALAFSCLLIFAFAHVCVAQGTSKGPASPASKGRLVKIYFYHEPGEYIDLSPVTRRIRSAAPARAALEALLRGPTAAEEKRGFGGLASAHEFSIASLRISRRIARVNFVARRTWTGFPGDTAPIRFKKAVELTLGQFANVRRVVVSLNGELDFETED